MNFHILDQEEREFLKSFEDQSLDEKAFNHKAHVRMAWLYLRLFEWPEALEKIKSGISNFARAKGVFVQIYHETITVAFAHIISQRIKEDQSEWESFIGKNADLVHGGKGLLENYYSGEVIFAAEARHTFIPPDRASFEVQS